MFWLASRICLDNCRVASQKTVWTPGTRLQTNAATA
jgi:hypothetical protein